MRKCKKILALLLVSFMCFSSFQGNVQAAESSSYDEILDAYAKGQQMDDWVVEARKQIAEEIGLSEYLDECSFLSIEYRNENKIGRDGDITDTKLNLLVEMATDEEVEAILAKSLIRTLAETRAITSGQTIGVTQMTRVSGAGNGYFTVSGANSYGYCAQNSMDFWSNNQTKYGTATEWNNATVRKVLYYAPGGPGYAGSYYGSLGADMDYATYAIGKLNGDCANNTKATAFINRVSGYADPLSSGYKAYKADIASPYQDVAFLAYAPTNGYLKAVKSSANPEITDGNEAYSFEGAVYGVFSDYTCTNQKGKLTFDAAGNSNTLTLSAGTYYLKEITAPKGYALNPAIITVVVSSGNTTTAKVTDIPQMDPVGVLLGKVDAETNANKPENMPSLKDAWFEFKFYGVLLEDETIDPADLGYTPERSWVFATDDDGFCVFLDDYLVSGDEFYYSSSGAPSIPIGTITIQEIKAPEGWLLNDDLFVRQILPEGTVEDVNTYNYPIIPENILKLDLVKKQEGTDIVIQDAQFEHTKPDGTTEILTTDANGELSFKGLEYGTHSIREIYAPEGFQINENVVTFNVAEDNTITLTSNTDVKEDNIQFEVTTEGNIAMTVYDKLIPYKIIVHKENENGVKLSGAEFALYLDAACTQLLEKGVTDKDGILVFSNLEAETAYYLKEEKAPEGYRLNTDASGNPVVTEIFAHNIPSLNLFGFTADGTWIDSSSQSELYSVSKTGTEWEANVTIINMAQYKLPETGSGMTIAIMAFGIGLFAAGTGCSTQKDDKKHRDRK